MIDYYLCAISIAKQHCIGLPYCCVCDDKGTVRYVSYHSIVHPVTTLLLKDVDIDSAVLLALKDPLFRKITEDELSEVMRDRIQRDQKWEILC